MKLYVCWGTFKAPGGHACQVAHEALKEAGYDPEVAKVYSSGLLPDITPGRKEVKRLTGQSYVPVLVTDDGETIHESKAIVEWAKAHPATATTSG